MIHIFVRHGFTIEVKADETGAGFDIKDSFFKVIGSEWCEGDTFDKALRSAQEYADCERERSGQDGKAA